MSFLQGNHGWKYRLWCCGPSRWFAQSHSSPTNIMRYELSIIKHPYRLCIIFRMFEFFKIQYLHLITIQFISKFPKWLLKLIKYLPCLEHVHEQCLTLETLVQLPKRKKYAHQLPHPENWCIDQLLSWFAWKLTISWKLPDNWIDLRHWKLLSARLTWRRKID